MVAQPRPGRCRGMTIKRLDHVSVVVDDLAAAIAFSQPPAFSPPCAAALLGAASLELVETESRKSCAIAHLSLIAHQSSIPRASTMISKTDYLRFDSRRFGALTNRHAHMTDRTTPPSTRSAAPLVAEAASLAAYTIMLAISSGVAKRLMSEVGRTLVKNSRSAFATSTP